MLLHELVTYGVATPPKWLPNNTCYLALTGSVAYGVSDDLSDMDLYGFCLPPKEMVFPHLAGYVPGFGAKPETFDEYEQHHIKVNDKSYDLKVYSIVRYFHLLLGSNPNMVDSLFVPERFVQHQTAVGLHVRDNRKLFLAKNCFPAFRGFAKQEINKVIAKKGSSNPRRAALIEKYGYDTKAMYHVFRLLLECWEILYHHDLVLDRNAVKLKAVRNGEYDFDQLMKEYAELEKMVETAYNLSTLRERPDEAEVKKLLLECMEQHYGRLEVIMKTPVVGKTMSPDGKLLGELNALVAKYTGNC